MRSSIRLAVILIVGMSATVAAQDGFPQRWRAVDGRTEPHLLPQHATWEMAFRDLVHFAADETGADFEEKVASLAKYNLYIAPAEVRQVLDTARRVLARVDEIRGPLNEEHGSGRSLGWSAERRRQTVRAAERAVIDGKRELQARMKPRAFKALERWVVKSSFGMVVYVPE